MNRMNRPIKMFFVSLIYLLLSARQQFHVNSFVLRSPNQTVNVHIKHYVYPKNRKYRDSRLLLNLKKTKRNVHDNMKKVERHKEQLELFHLINIAERRYVLFSARSGSCGGASFGGLPIRTLRARIPEGRIVPPRAPKPSHLGS